MLVVSYLGLALLGVTTAITARYFELSAKIESAKRDGDCERAIRAARDTYPILRTFAREWVREYGTFDINTSHAVDTAAPLMAVMGDRGPIVELRETLQRIPEMQNGTPVVEQAERDAEVADQILVTIKQHPGVLRNQLKKHVATDETRRFRTLAGGSKKAAVSGTCVPRTHTD